MNTFVTSVKETQLETRTINGMKTFDSSKNAIVDLFFSIGASRDKDMSVDFNRAFAQDPNLALRLLLWARDVRGGAGEREVVRKILLNLEQNNPEILSKILCHLPEFGRWDDLLIFKTKEIKYSTFDLISSALKDGNGLCAKWLPRKGNLAAELRNHLKMSPKQYRKCLVELTKVVEQHMCAGTWTEINYSHVPSLAAARYQSAFKRHDIEGYTKYKEQLLAGEAKINANAVYPYDIIKSYLNGGDSTVVQAQWDSLPNYIGDQLILPVIDVSGSMYNQVGGNKNLTCLDVSISLGLYLADKNTGPFKDMFLTFSECSKLEVLSGNLISKITQLQKSDWGMNTNLHSAFDSILTYALKGKVIAEDMPKYILILSDMEFDEGVEHDDSAMEMIKRKYQESGYNLPNVVFWNLNARSGNIPVKYNAEGVALISGLSPAIMKSILAAKTFTPMDIVLETLNNPRYCVV